MVLAKTMILSCKIYNNHYGGHGITHRGVHIMVIPKSPRFYHIVKLLCYLPKSWLHHDTTKKTMELNFSSVKKHLKFYHPGSVQEFTVTPSCLSEKDHGTSIVVAS